MTCFSFEGRGAGSQEAGGLPGADDNGEGSKGVGAPEREEHWEGSNGGGGPDKKDGHAGADDDPDEAEDGLDGGGEEDQRNWHNYKAANQGVLLQGEIQQDVLRWRLYTLVLFDRNSMY